MTPAAARDVCTALTSTTLVFRNVKKLKPGRAVPLSGIGILSSVEVVPLHGSAIMDSTGTIERGFTAYGMLDGIPNEMFHAMVDESFSGTIQADANGDFLPQEARLPRWRSADKATTLTPGWPDPVS